MEVDDFEMIGGRPDIVYTCDYCGTHENETDEDGGVHWMPMYRFESYDICSWCLERIIEERRPVPAKIQWNLQGF